MVRRMMWALMLAGCGAAAPMQAPVMKPIGAEAAPVLTENHFRQDKSGVITEEALRAILAAPTFLEDGARLGVVQVATGYEVDGHVPLAGVPQVLTEKLEDTGLFEIASEMTNDWPADGSIRGLRELGARYRAEYLLLYRHRFVDRSIVNGWAWTWPTVVGLFAAPAQTVETAGVLEATLFDVKTGTLLFTVFERVDETMDVNLWHEDWKVRKLEERLLADAAAKLAKQVVAKVHRLAALRPKPEGQAVAGG
jgi:hypothetical protein